MLNDTYYFEKPLLPFFYTYLSHTDRRVKILLILWL